MTDHWDKAVDAAIAAGSDVVIRQLAQHPPENSWVPPMEVALRAALPHLVEAVVAQSTYGDGTAENHEEWTVRELREYAARLAKGDV